MTLYTPNLPALITALPSDRTRAPQTEFTRARQVTFLENLSITGSVRSAACAAGTSHQTAYRSRRSTPAFRTAWDAALVVARAAAADTLACRAIEGVEEKVFYHGEEIATRTRFSDRLLLAHLARLDRLAETPAANAFAEDFDAALARFERGEEAVPPHAHTPADAALETAAREAAAREAADRPEKLSPGPCNTRSMSSARDAAQHVESGNRKEGGAHPLGNEASDGDEDHDDGDYDDEDGYDEEDAEPEGYGAPEAYSDLFDGESPREARLPVVDRLYAAMDRRRPADAPVITGPWHPTDLLDEQLNAFAARVEQWWLVIPPAPGDPADEFRYHDPAA